MVEQPRYLFLDDEPERELLIARIHDVREAVSRLAATIPDTEHYEPRYHGWSLAAMLGHLNFADNVSMWLIQAGLLGFRPRVPLAVLNWVNDTGSQVFRQRLVKASLRSMQRNEKRIASLVRHLPVSKFSRQVFHPNTQQFVTIERAVQDLLLYHWHDHLATMREVEALRSRANSES